MTCPGASPAYAIALVPYLAISVDTTSVDFGMVDPGQLYGPTPVAVGVTSNLPVTLTRALTGDFALMGLTVSGGADGLKPAGTALYTDLCSLNVPWSTDPGVQLNVTTIIADQNHEQHVGIEHIAIETDDYAGTLANIKKNGAQILEERFNNGRHVCWVAAPDGAQMELIEKV